MVNLYDQTDWALLREQKTYLIEMLGRETEHAEHLEGLLGFIDAVQDDAHACGYPVFPPVDDEDPYSLIGPMFPELVKG